MLGVAHTKVSDDDLLVHEVRIFGDEASLKEFTEMDQAQYGDWNLCYDNDVEGGALVVMSQSARDSMEHIPKGAVYTWEEDMIGGDAYLTGK